MSVAERVGSWALGFAAVTVGVFGCSSDGSGADAGDGIDSAGTDPAPGGSETTGEISTSTTSGEGTSSGPVGVTSMAPDDDGDDEGPGDPPVVLDVNAVPEGNASCEEQAPTIDFLEPTMVMVLDHSGSMGSNFSDPKLGFITRWNALHNAVTFILETYAPVVEFGVKVFPSDNSCGVSAGLDVDPALDNGEAILGSMPPANSNGTGLTPAYEGFVQGATALLAADPDRPRAALLLLDGAAGCAGSPALLTAEIATLFEDEGIPTYVVGVDINAATRADMNGYAEAGGVPLGMPGDLERFYNATDTTQLQAFMDVVIGDLLSCDLDLDPAPEHPSLTEVDIDGNAYELIDAKACDAGEEGWTYSVEYTQIRLCGPACEAYRDVQQANVAFFCPQG